MFSRPVLGSAFLFTSNLSYFLIYFIYKLGNLLIELEKLYKNRINRITALWAFSEAALGGILHALKIPFTGLFIGSSAVIFISLISYYSDSPRQIIESTLNVLLVKFVVSPYAPINAYLAVILQSSLGFMFFYKGFNKLSPLLLGFFALLFSGIQKIIILTLVFGMTIWESIDIFFNFVIESIFGSSHIVNDFSISYIIVMIYVLSHLIAGLVAGFYASLLPERLEQQNSKRFLDIKAGIENFLTKNQKKKKRRWWRKPSSIALFVFFIFLIILSFSLEEIENQLAYNILTMIIRSILIITIWYYFISPLLLRFVKKYLLKKSQKKAEEIDVIVGVFPSVRSIIKYSWDMTSKYKGLRRIIIFIDQILINFILFEDSHA